MSQQEFFQHQDNTTREQQTSSYRISGKGGKKGGMPKDEPVGDDDYAMLHGYRAQEYGPWEQEQSTPSSFESARESTHREHTAQKQGVPDWARPQKNNSRGILIALFIVAALLLIKPLLIVVGILLALLGATIGIVLLAIVLPLVLFAVILVLVLLAMRVTFGRAFRPRRFYDQSYWRRYTRGSRW